MCNSSKLVIAFRGTEFTLVDGIGIDDIITDLDVKDRDPRSSDGGQSEKIQARP